MMMVIVVVKFRCGGRRQWFATASTGGTGTARTATELCTRRICMHALPGSARARASPFLAHHRNATRDASRVSPSTFRPPRPRLYGGSISCNAHVHTQTQQPSWQSATRAAAAAAATHPRRPHTREHYAPLSLSPSVSKSPRPNQSGARRTPAHPSRARGPSSVLGAQCSVLGAPRARPTGSRQQAGSRSSVDKLKGPSPLCRGACGVRG
ncbi:hypothetical protein BC628DRAFT_232348 [Trametes gibbosa]|nr:hypothetical protein BC628DRAFT_232348 [Trametes gibbosa]